MQNVRMVFAKEGRAAFISHLDLIRCISRAMSRANLPVYYTQGFNPQPYLVFSPPLSLGYIGEAEICDFSVTDDAMSLDEVLARLTAVMPQGVRPISCKAPVHKLGAIAWAEYRIELCLTEDAAKWKEAVRSCLTQQELKILKKSKRGEREVNLTELIDQLEIEENGENTVILRCRLPLTGENSLNPRYVIEVLRQIGDFPLQDETVIRTQFLLEDKTPFC